MVKSTVHTSINLNLENKEMIAALASENHISFNAMINQIIDEGLNKKSCTSSVHDELKELKKHEDNNFVLMSQLINAVYLMLVSMSHDKTGIDYVKYYKHKQGQESFQDVFKFLKNEVEK